MGRKRLPEPFFRDIWWLTQDGRLLQVKDMEDSHLLNAIAYLRTRIREKEDRLGLRIANLCNLELEDWSRNELTRVRDILMGEMYVQILLAEMAYRGLTAKYSDEVLHAL